MLTPDKSDSLSDNCSDGELCILVKNGNSAALSVLLHRYSGAVLKKAKTVYCNGLDSDDLYQEGMIALIRAAVTYNGAGNASFKTYAFVCIINRFRDLIRKNKKNPISADIDGIENVCDPEEDFITKDESDRLMRILKARLSEKEKAIVLDHLAGLSYASIARKNGCDVKSVNNALSRVRKKLKQLK